MKDSIRGAGLGLRSPHLSHILEHRPSVPWFEILTDNYLNRGNQPHKALREVRANYPIVFHGVGMNLGSTDPLRRPYFDRVSELIAEYEPEWVSDHLCWVGVGETFSNDLLPLPYTREALDHLTQRISQAQEWIRREILIENLSQYVCYEGAEYSEWEFINEVARRSGCYLLLDVNNVYVNSQNLGFNPHHFIDAVPRELVKQMHLAGYEASSECLIDSHGKSVSEQVWSLYRYALDRIGPTPTLIEWDKDIPEFSVLYDEAKHADTLLQGVSV